MLGSAYLVVAEPRYTAEVKILMDPRNAKGGNDYSDLSRLGLDSGAVDSQVEVIKSERIVSAVISKLDLLNDPKFADLLDRPAGGAVDLLKNVLTLSFLAVGPQSEGVDQDYALRRAARTTLRRNMKVSRVGVSYVLEVSYTSPYAGLSERVANAVAEAYLTDQLDSKYDAARRASTWLGERVNDVRQKSVQSDLAVQTFRSEHGLITAEGELVSEQQLKQISSELIVARADTGRAEARYKRIQSIIADGETEAAVSESLDNSVINSLREKYVDASKREAEISNQLGKDHLAAVRLRSNMDEYRRLIFQELGRIAQSYESEYKVALAREQSLESNLEKLVKEAADSNQTQVKLRELEQEAESYKAQYDTLLRRYQETVQQQSFPITEARVITPALRPVVPSGPSKTMVLALCAMLGMMVGVGVGALREFMERGFRTAGQVRDELDQDCIGLLPVIHPDIDAPPASDANNGTTPRSPRLVDADPYMKYVLEHPTSAYAETLRAAMVAVDFNLPDRKHKTIGVVSVFPKEGKSTVSKGLATLLASAGNKTLLVDGDLRNPVVSRSILPRATEGLLEILRDGRPLRELLGLEQTSKLFVLPTVSKNAPLHPSMLLSSPAMKDVLKQAGGSFDYVIIDLPPITPVVDVRAVATVIDAFLLVVDWGKTPRKLVRSALESDRRLRDKCLGVILNNVDPEKAHLYGDGRSAGFCNADYAYAR